MSCTFIADLRLDPATPKRSEAFRATLRQVSDHCDDLYVFGDLTEACIGADDGAPLRR